MTDCLINCCCVKTKILSNHFTHSNNLSRSWLLSHNVTLFVINLDKLLVTEQNKRIYLYKHFFSSVFKSLHGKSILVRLYIEWKYWCIFLRLSNNQNAFLKYSVFRSGPFDICSVQTQQSQSAACLCHNMTTKRWFSITRHTGYEGLNSWVPITHRGSSCALKPDRLIWLVLTCRWNDDIIFHRLWFDCATLRFHRPDLSPSYSPLSV